MPDTKQSIMRRFDLSELPPCPEAAKAFEIFKECTKGFLEMARLAAWRPEALPKAFEQFGFDCYTQGCIDGAQAAMMRPELTEFLRAQHSENEHAPV